MRFSDQHNFVRPPAAEEVTGDQHSGTGIPAKIGHCRRENAILHIYIEGNKYVRVLICITVHLMQVLRLPGPVHICRRYLGKLKYAYWRLYRADVKRKGRLARTTIAKKKGQSDV